MITYLCFLISQKNNFVETFTDPIIPDTLPSDSEDDEEITSEDWIAAGLDPNDILGEIEVIIIYNPLRA